MNACEFHELGCNQRDVLPVRLWPRRDLQLMCSGCRASIGQVVTIVERRVAAVRVARDRRRFTARWIRIGNLARDETASVLR